MKVRSWKELILYLLLGGAIIAYGFKNLAEKDSNGITYILVAIIMLIRAVPDAISEEKHEENAFRAYAAQWYCRGQFGAFAPVMPWLGLLLLLLDGILVMLLPIVSVVRVLAGLLLGAALLSVILYGVWENGRWMAWMTRSKHRLRLIMSSMSAISASCKKPTASGGESLRRSFPSLVRCRQ